LLMHRLYLGNACEKNYLRASAINTLLMQTGIAVEPAISPTHPHFAQPHHLLELPELPMPSLQEDAFEQPLEIISESPWVCVSDNLLSEEECHLLRYLGAPHLKPSITADPDGKLLQVSLRSSYDMVLDEFLEDISLLLAQRRMAALMGTTPAYSEPLHLLRYQNGQEYKPHRDYLPPSLILPVEQGGPGQRESTAIVYLNDMKNGGETEFLEINKKIAPKTGRVLGFRNLLPDGSPDTRTLHAGLPVKFGTKWIATLWIHQGVFRV
jgi:prolyl 4-hydroxylase